MTFTYQGYTIDQPGVIATQQSQGMVPASASSRLVVLLGISSTGGKPKTLTTLGGKQDVSNLLTGDLRKAGFRAFAGTGDPNPTSSPSVAYMRVNPAVQASLNLQSSGAITVVQLQSTEYGNPANRVNAQIQSGSTQGLKATVKNDTTTYSKDNLYSAAFSIQYTGADASGLVTVDNATHNMTGSSGAAGAETAKFTADFTTYTNIQQLVNFINSQVGWTATILTASPNAPTQNALDDVTGQQCKASAFTVTATLQALVNWLNTVPIVTATRPSGVGALPVVMSTPSYLTGGSDGAATTTDWQNAFTALQNIPGARIVVPVTGDSAVHAMAASHASYMSDPTIRKNRVVICGGVSGEQVSAVTARASSLNSRRVSLVWPGVQDIDDDTNALATYDPYITAAQAAGILSTLPITGALTHKVLKAKNLEGDLASTLQVTDYNTLATSGVMAIKPFQTDTASGFWFVRSLTTWLQDTALDNIELSMVCNEDYVDIKVGDALDALVGATGGPVGTGQVISEVDSTLRELQKEGAIVGDKTQAAYGNIVANVSGDRITSTYDATVPAPMNFFGVTSTFRTYSTTAVA